MRLYLQLSFWVNALAVFCGVIIMGMATYPRVRTPRALWEDMVAIILGLLICFWLAVLLWIIP